MAKRDYVGVLLRRWQLTLLVPAVLAGATYFATAYLPKTYEGQAIIRVAVIRYSDNVMNLTGPTGRDLVACFTAREVLEEVGKDLRLLEEHGIDLPASAGSLVSASSPRGSSHIVVSAQMPSGELAQATA